MTELNQQQEQEFQELRQTYERKLWRKQALRMGAIALGCLSLLIFFFVPAFVGVDGESHSLVYLLDKEAYFADIYMTLIIICGILSFGLLVGGVLMVTLAFISNIGKENEPQQLLQEVYTGTVNKKTSDRRTMLKETVEGVGIVIIVISVIVQFTIVDVRAALDIEIGFMDRFQWFLWFVGLVITPLVLEMVLDKKIENQIKEIQIYCENRYGVLERRLPTIK